MNRYGKRLLVALCISSGCYYGTVFWYKNASSGMTANIDKKHIATLVMHDNEVQRKPLARVIWESITDGDALYAGESIRTTDLAEAKIKFNSGALIELEPDSLIVLEENDGEVAIDYLRGNLLVKGGSGKAGALNLKSGKSSIDLKNANLALTKSKKGDVDLQVFGGNATLTQDGKTQSLADGGTLTDTGLTEDKNRIKVLFPTPGEPVYINPRAREPVIFQWEKLPPGYMVYLERGKKRGKLRRYKRAQAKGEAGELKVRFKIGKYYWRLVAEPQQQGLEERSSKVTPSQILAKSPPILIEPDEAAKVVIKQDDPKFRIKWANKTKVESMIVQMAKDPQFKQSVLSEEQQALDPVLDFKDISLAKSGKYYWRVVSYMPIRGKMVPLSSEVRSFNLQVGINLVPPKLRSPMPKQRFSYNQVVTSGLFLTWDPVPGIDNYKVVIKKLRKKKGKKGEKSKWIKKEFLTREIATSPLKFQNFKPGRYEWTVYSIDKSGKRSKASEKRRFRVDQIPRVYFVDGPDPTEHLYFTKSPQIYTAWKRNGGINQWRVRYAKEGELSDESPWTNVKTPVLNQIVKDQGRYEVEVEALDDKGKTVARSKLKEVNVREKPLLPAPEFAEALPEVLKADRRGTLKLRWDPVDGANKYKLQVKSGDGKVLREAVVDRNIASVRKLKPGQYNVTVQTIDEHSRPGPEGESRNLTVPNKSYIKAPKINKFKVK